MKESHKKVFINIFKYLPTIFVAFLTLHIMFLVNNFAVPFTQYLVDSSFLGGGLLITSSILFDMCKWHKACIWYTIIVTLLMDLQKMFGLGIFLWPFRIIALIVGVVLCFGLLYSFIKRKIKE